METVDDCLRPCDVYLLPLPGWRIGNIQAEVVNIETELVGAVEVADGDVALLSCILAQIGGVFGVLVGDDGLMVSVTLGVLTIPPGIGVGEAYKNVPIAKAMST